MTARLIHALSSPCIECTVTVIAAIAKPGDGVRLIVSDDASLADHALAMRAEAEWVAVTVILHFMHCDRNPRA